MKVVIKLPTETNQETIKAVYTFRDCNSFFQYKDRDRNTIELTLDELLSKIGISAQFEKSPIKSTDIELTITEDTITIKKF